MAEKKDARKDGKRVIADGNGHTVVTSKNWKYDGQLNKTTKVHTPGHCLEPEQ